METAGGDRWWRPMEIANGDSWWRPMETAGGDRWWRPMETAGGNRCYLIHKTVNKLLIKCMFCRIIYTFWLSSNNISVHTKERNNV